MEQCAESLTRGNVVNRIGARSGVTAGFSGASLFKYYIHDGIDSLRLQLIGELTEGEVTDLDGCWRTARTTLAGRPLVIDVQTLAKVDEAGKRWLAAMAVEGARFIPDCYLRGAIASDTPLAKPPGTREKVTFWNRLIAWIRGTPLPID
jgi:hypothetical protein